MWSGWLIPSHGVPVPALKDWAGTGTPNVVDLAGWFFCLPGVVYTLRG